MYVHSNMPLNNFFYCQQETVFMKEEKKNYGNRSNGSDIIFCALLHVTMYGKFDWFMAKKIYFNIFTASSMNIFYFGNYLLDLHAGYSDYLKPSYIIISSIFNSSVSCNGRKEDSHRTIFSCWCFRTFENSL